ncbi:flagellar basal body rod protein FlgB [Euzebya sp.]|uniref:flagellar basal body rod protein FlgB n=1 Tax=Euzebya sp. TaxID=1971409 RepID=UPI0035128A52
MAYDITSAALHSALRGLSTRRNVQAQNIANVDTPGYLAGRVSFEDTLAGALDDVRRGRAGRDATAAVRPEMQTSIEATRLNGNNVNLDDEIVSNTETELAYSTVLEALNAKFRLLRTSINGR